MMLMAAKKAAKNVADEDALLCLPPNYFRNLFQFEEQIFCPLEVCMLLIG